MNDVLPTLRRAGSALLDRWSEWSGYAAIRVPLQRASRPGEFTLPLPGYRQIDSFSCGAVAAAMAVKFLRPRLGFQRVYGMVDPSPQTGAGPARVTRALRSLGIRVRFHTDLTFPVICRLIRGGNPVLVCVKTGQPDTIHWVTVYGYGRRPDVLFVAGWGMPFIGWQRLAWKQFARLWTPPGTGLACRRKRS